jgi:hypothetical protein
MKTLIENWLKAKEIERHATEDRRDIEDQMAEMMAIPPTLEGTLTDDQEEGYVIKVVGRIDRKVDSDKIQELAAEHGLSEHLASLCRWKPELNLTAWKAADEAITKALAPAITAKPGRPSFSITTSKKD